mgnify:CR=1 FL=1|jgi:hypothetical protein|tara:strand:- start:574 stop:807 length:234 start_codon:yes stop_codon:yes gene_type:complete
MRLFTRFTIKDICLFKFDICIKKFNNAYKKAWFEFRILGFGIDIDFGPNNKLKIWPVAMDTKNLIIPAIKRLIGRTK